MRLQGLFEVWRSRDLSQDAFFQEHIPGAMFFLGVANEEEGITAYNHFPDYDLDESALTIGTAAMAAVLVEYLAVR